MFTATNWWTADWFRPENQCRKITMAHIVVIRDFDACMSGGSALKKSNVRQSLLKTNLRPDTVKSLCWRSETSIWAPGK